MDRKIRPGSILYVFAQLFAISVHFLFEKFAAMALLFTCRLLKLAQIRASIVEAQKSAPSQWNDWQTRLSLDHYLFGQRSWQEKFSSITQAVIPKNNNSYALEKTIPRRPGHPFGYFFFLTAKPLRLSLCEEFFFFSFRFFLICNLITPLFIMFVLPRLALWLLAGHKIL